MRYPMKMKRPTANEWLLDWFSKNDNKITLNDLSFWMPNGLHRSYESVTKALTELNCDLIFDNGEYAITYKNENNTI